MKTKEASLSGLVLVSMPFFTLCMCFGVIETLHECGCHAHILGSASVAVLGALSFLPIREIYKHTGRAFGCVLSGGFNGLVMVFCYMIASHTY
ncbi:iron transporter [Helicobacter baculiformis]|uniref:Iron transporter n=1 Tax=Helicobacter baculiformis TaxID=427351 RepID=A0ABV7ZLB1_9HELI|nr:iron transporter [Helicobacter baculiformis]